MILVDNIKEFFSKENMQVLFNDEYEKENLWFDMIVLTFIFFSCFIFILETSNALVNYMYIFHKVDILLNFFFSVEIFLRIIYSTDLKKHFSSTYTYIDLFAIFPFWIGAGTFAFFRAFRFFRVFRIFRFLRYSSKYLSEKAGDLHKNSTIEKIFIGKILFSIFLFLYVSSALIYEIEGQINPHIHNFADALYFVMISVSTVGFGDIVPVTSLGKLIIMITVLAGLIIVPWHLSSLVKSLSILSMNKNIQSNEDIEEELEEKLEESFSFCPHCGKGLKGHK